jgi:hypothetical protein
VPISAASIKINGKWIDLPDVNMERDGREYLPIEAYVELAKL